MRDELLENKEFNILSRSIDNAAKCTVINIEEDCFEVRLQMKGKYEVDESVELFTMTSKGQLYFETIVKEVKDDIVSMWFPITYKYLQRREYTRIQTDKKITLINADKTTEATISDISAGGLKVITSEQLELMKHYDVSIEIDNKLIKCAFEPIRIETNGINYISSGRFINISNSDRISLVQYCFRKQIENSNK